MAENRMKQVAKIFDLEKGEEFLVDFHDGSGKHRYSFENGGVFNLEKSKFEDETLGGLLTGEYEIEKIPWRAKPSETFWSFGVGYCPQPRGSLKAVDYCLPPIGSLKVVKLNECGNFSDTLRYRLGFYYKTEEEAEADRPRAEKFFMSNQRIDV